MNLLVCTLGGSWAVVPEVFGFVAPQRLNLYANHPQAAELQKQRERYDLRAPDEIWVITTEGEQAQHACATLREWCRHLPQPPALRIWTAAESDQLATQAECDRIRELTLRVVLHAARACGGQGQLLLSLAGGRKTMSADLQSAGALFGAHAWLHVVGFEPLPPPLRAAEPELFRKPLPADLAGAITPLVVGRGSRNELLDIVLDDRRVDVHNFPLPLAEPDCRWTPPAQRPSLAEEIECRLREGSRVLGNFVGTLSRSEPADTWRSLFRLAPATIEHLRQTPLQAQHRNWLLRLPKADLHRHLGGSLALPAQRAVGRAIWEALSAKQREAALRTVAPLLRGRADWPWDWPQRIAGQLRAACAAALLVEADEQTLLRNLYEATEPRLRLKDSPRGFAAYERPGELTGSAVLTHPAALPPYAAALVEQARAEGLMYVELRGSPHKYRPEDPAGFLRDLQEALRRAGAGAEGGPRFGFVWILDRRQRETMPAVIEMAVAARRGLEDFLLGLDLAGAEGTQQPEQLADAFTPAFRECLRITIHAGEGERAENIWQAAYRLHADRIGHGLTLLENPALTERFRDRGICIELCPTSNREVVGFRDPAVPASEALPPYPLRRMLAAGLPVTLCTDNPGISRTTLADEFLTAARMSDGALSLWQVLALLRAGFAHAFLPARERQRLLAQADAEVFRCAAAFPAVAGLVG